jgi:phage terminase large subunit
VVDLIDDPELLVVKSTYRDNPFLTADDLQRYESMRARSEYHAQVYLDGQWGNLSGVIITNVRSEDLTGNVYDNVYHGLDFGFNPDPAAYVKVAVSGNRIYITHEYVAKGLSNDALANAIAGHVGDEIVWCDSAEPKSIFELRAAGINARPVKKTPDSVRYGAQWLQQKEIIVDHECVNAKREISQWQWEKDKHGNELPQPVGINDHTIAALRYALERVMSRRAFAGVVTSASAGTNE